MMLLKKKHENQLDDKAKSYVNFPIDGIKRMLQIIPDVFDFSRAKTQKEKLKKLDLNEELVEVLSLLHPGIKQKYPDSEIGKLCKVYDSKTTIRHRSQNLLGNASGM